MEESWIMLNSVPTHIFTWGQRAQDTFDKDISEIVLMISGNPGLPGFYTSFCSTLFNELDKKIPCWLIGHAGHDEPKKELQLTIPPLEGNNDLYSLQGQVQHKREFITKYIPKDVKIHLVSHSIGAKLSLELLKFDEISEQIHRCYMLFPTIEKMVESSNGFWFYKVFNRIFLLIQLIYYAFDFLPLKVRTIIISFAFCIVAGYPKYFLGTLIKTLAPSALDKIWFMAEDEMKQVCDIDSDVINMNMHRLKFYYGTRDGWVPSQYYHKLIEKFPGIDAELCSQKIDHGFVISHGPTMARMLSDWVKRQKVSQTF